MLCLTFGKLWKKTSGQNSALTDCVQGTSDVAIVMKITYKTLILCKCIFWIFLTLRIKMALLVLCLCSDHCAIASHALLLAWCRLLTSRHGIIRSWLLCASTFKRQLFLLPCDALVHSAVLRLLSSVCPSVRLSVRPSVCNDQVPWWHRLEFF